MSLLDILKANVRSVENSSSSDQVLFPVATIENKLNLQPTEPEVFSENACPKCGSNLEWLPRLANDAWKCFGCLPPLHCALVAETRERACYKDDRVIFDPITVCVEKQVCKCGGRWLDITMNGYRCGVCNAVISMSADQIFWSSVDYASLHGGADSTRNERVFTK